MEFKPVALPGTLPALVYVPLQTSALCALIKSRLWEGVVGEAMQGFSGPPLSPANYKMGSEDGRSEDGREGVGGEEAESLYLSRELLQCK